MAILLLAALLPLAGGAPARPVEPSFPAAPENRTLEQAAALAQLKLEANDDTDEQWVFVENPLHGPIEVSVIEVGGESANARLHTDPPLPARGVVPAMTQRLMTRIHNTSDRSRLKLIAIPGRPGSHANDVEYQLPLQGAELRVSQAWNGDNSHSTPEHHYAVDFASPVGTQVLAARDGVVMQVESGFADHDPASDRRPGRHDIERANVIRVLHDDGSMALYAHLRHAGVQVQPGQRIRRGQAIALSGNSGLSHGPHLHFAVQVNRGMRLESVPFRMFGPQGLLRFGPGATSDSDAATAALSSP